MTARLAPAAALLLAAALTGCATSYEDGYYDGYGYYGSYGYGDALPYGYYGPYYGRDDDDYLWPYLYYFPHDRDRRHRHDREHDRWRDRDRSHDGAPPPAGEPQPPEQAGPGLIEPVPPGPGLIEPVPPGGGRHQGRAGPRPGRPFEAGPPSQPARRERGEARAGRETAQDAPAADRQPPRAGRESAARQTAPGGVFPGAPRRQKSQR